MIPRGAIIHALESEGCSPADALRFADAVVAVLEEQGSGSPNGDTTPDVDERGHNVLHWALSRPDAEALWREKVARAGGGVGEGECEMVVHDDEWWCLLHRVPFAHDGDSWFCPIGCADDDILVGFPNRIDRGAS